MSLDINAIRNDFPALQRLIKGKPPVYFDNACMTLRPHSVIDAMTRYYREHPSCHRRSIHRFGKETTAAYDKAKKTVRAFINAKDADEIVFTKNATAGINIVAHGLNFQPGDVILTTTLEHNSNFLPWQFVAKKAGANLAAVPLTPELTFDLDAYRKALTDEVKVVAVAHKSHITGYTYPVKEIIQLAHARGAVVLIDAAQSATQDDIDVQELDADFLVFSFHKMLGPSGTGCLYGKKSYLDNLTPVFIGGETVDDVSHNAYTLTKVPERFEAGLQDYGGAMGVTAAVEYLQRVGRQAVRAHLEKLNAVVTQGIADLPKVRILGPAAAAQRGGIINFQIDGMDAGELSIILDETDNIMTRSGVHCCHAGYKRHNLSPSLRVSFYMYNTEQEAELFVDRLKKIVRFF
ncbi:MAG: aminotransferase class V-fold PLP-dependent enzyme [Candidatus Omnitrophica bacterium]|nr:aminotransferase class V-fold PLP-dependent enzyme [Candidatus Omnitrophota bacterium]MCB9719863.1 aminotransferase class V-fold PLP-dependent enzyme [Candidatus Omnitrophota bacterium]